MHEHYIVNESRKLATYALLGVTEMESIEKSNVIQYSITALRKELWVASIYALVARSYREKDPQLADRLNQLSIEEKTHAEFWTQFLEKRDQHIAITINPIRLVFFKVLYMIIGLGLTLKLLENTKIENNVLLGPYVTIGKSCVIGDSSKISNSIIYDMVIVGKFCELEWCIIDEDVELPESFRAKKCFITRINEEELDIINF